MQAYVESPIAYRLAVAASATLGSSWVSYLAYLGGATITKQSVYLGAITFYAALLLAVTCIALVVLVFSVGYLARTRHHRAKAAALWGALAISMAIILFVVTRPLINGAA